MEALQLWVCVWGHRRGSWCSGGGSHLHFLGPGPSLTPCIWAHLRQPWGWQSDLAWWCRPLCTQLLPHPTTKRLTPTTGILRSPSISPSWDQLCQYLCWSCVFHSQDLWTLV